MLLNDTNASLRKALAARESASNLRSLAQKEHLIDFCSNDYLGFARNPELWQRAEEILRQRGIQRNGASGSRLISGNYALYEETEAFIAQYHKAEAALIFNSGYDANVGFFSSVPQRQDVVFYDELVHASIIDGMRLGRAGTSAYKHNDLNDLEEKLKKTDGNAWIGVESVFSMDGDFAPLEQICGLAESFGARVVVDEAHATGIFGKAGEGRVVELGLEDRCFARIHTYGKAMGVHGAAIVGSDLLKQFLVNFARSFIFTTALPFHSIAMIKSAYDMLSCADNKVNKISQLATLFKERVKVDDGLILMKSSSPIQSLLVPGNERAKSISAQLEQEGMYVKAILHPTVPAGTERLRVCFHALNSEEEVEKLVGVLNGI